MIEMVNIPAGKGDVNRSFKKNCNLLKILNSGSG
jgi:hypothetical protein